MKKKEFWIPFFTNAGIEHPILTDKNGRRWAGGSISIVWIPLFQNKKEASRFAKSSYQARRDIYQSVRVRKAIIYRKLSDLGEEAKE